MKMTIQGMGLATPLGSTAELEKALTSPVFPETLKTDTAPLSDYVPARKLRRIDHFTRMTLLAAYRALDNAHVLGTLPDDMGIVIATGYGPAETTFDFLDSIIDDGAHLASPLSFSHSVHNIPAGVLSLLLGKPCPQTTICQLGGPIMAGLRTSALWLAEGRVKTVLFGAVDETTPLLEETSRRIADEKGVPAPIIGEGAAFFVLDERSTGLASIELNAAMNDAPIALGTLWESTPVKAAFNLVAATLSVKAKDEPAFCVENSHAIKISGADGA